MFLGVALGISFISIHALREESDWQGLLIFAKSLLISIHALREESDFVRSELLCHCYPDFNPRSP